MLHYTLNTANTFDCSQKQYDKGVLLRLNPIVKRALLSGQTLASLPEPFENYSLKVTTIEGAALFDVLGTGKEILTTNAVAYCSAGEQEVWALFESFYLRLGQQFGIILGRAPQIPDSLPWLATLALPNPEILQTPWLADFEQGFALTLIRESKAKPRPKGFG